MIPTWHLRPLFCRVRLCRNVCDWGCTQHNIAESLINFLRCTSFLFLRIVVYDWADFARAYLLRKCCACDSLQCCEIEDRNMGKLFLDKLFLLGNIVIRNFLTDNPALTFRIQRILVRLESGFEFFRPPLPIHVFSRIWTSCVPYSLSIFGIIWTTLTVVRNRRGSELQEVGYSVMMTEQWRRQFCTFCRKAI